MSNIIFLEGPAFAGKTTFLSGAPAEVIKLPEASEFLGGDAHFPDAPADAATMAYCSYFFAVMENERFKSIGADQQDRLVIADRFTPLSSMIFYALRHANGDIETSEYERGKCLSAAIFNRVVNMPEGQARFIRFDLSSPEQLAVRLPRGTRNGELASWDGLKFYNEQYDQALPSSTERVVDGVYDGELQSGEWMETETLLPRFVGSETISDEELERYLPETARRGIELEIQRLRKESL